MTKDAASNCDVPQSSMSRKQKVDCGNRTAPFWSADGPHQERENAETHFLHSSLRLANHVISLRGKIKDHTDALFLLLLTVYN